MDREMAGNADTFSEAQLKAWMSPHESVEPGMTLV